MTRNVFTVRLWRIEAPAEPSPWRDVVEIVAYSTLAGLVYAIWLVGVMP